MHRFTIAGLLAALFALPVRAGLYSPDEPFIFEIKFGICHRASCDDGKVR